MTDPNRAVATIAKQHLAIVIVALEAAAGDAGAERRTWDRRALEELIETLASGILGLTRGNQGLALSALALQRRYVTGEHAAAIDAALQQIRGDWGDPSEATAERHQRAAYHLERATYHEATRERLRLANGTRPPCDKCQAIYTTHRQAAEAHFRAQGQWGHPETRQADREAAAQDADRASELVRLIGIEDAWAHRGGK